MSKSNTKTIHFSKWNYHLDVDGVKINVCKALFISIFQVSKKRLRILQNKIVTGKPFDDTRGHHESFNKIQSETWKLLHQFIDKIPKDDSHYSREKSQKQYFHDSIITRIWLYKEYSKILVEQNMKIISYRSFTRYYYEKFNIEFKQPRTDICDICFEYLNIGKNNLTETQKLDFERHLSDYDDYKKLKSTILKNDLSSKLVIEFDYGQNKPLPKLNNTSNYYSRSLWFYVFNVYVHNTKKSYFYHFIEGQFRKGSNTVSTFIFQTLQGIDLSSFKEIVLFSDNCPGQNKNSIFFKSLIYFANYFHIKISHVYPVKGHSYCVCDRQFGLFTKKLKKIEVIEHPQKYIDILNELNFMVSNIEIKNFEKLFLETFNDKLNVKISTWRKITYNSNGQVKCFANYN